MITNTSLTIYHMNGLDVSSGLEKWVRYNYDKVWFFGGKGSSANKGYENANDFDCRIPYAQNSDLDISNFKIGDIVVPQKLDINITTQQDLNGYEFYAITSINNNNFGINQHIHLGGK